jgi:hypothetical protein
MVEGGPIECLPVQAQKSLLLACLSPRQHLFYIFPLSFRIIRYNKQQVLVYESLSY